MFLIITFIILSIVCILYGVASWEDEVGWFGGCLLIGTIVIACTTRVNIGETIKTGYIYTTKTQFGVTYGEIRIGENAGSDKQETICTEDSRYADKLKELSGSGKKVIVKEKGKGFNVTNKIFFFCNTEIQLIEELGSEQDLNKVK